MYVARSTSSPARVTAATARFRVATVVTVVLVVCRPGPLVGGHAHEELAARLEDPADLRQCTVLGIAVLDDVEGRDHVEGSRTERQVHRRPADVTGVETSGIDVHSDAVSSRAQPSDAGTIGTTQIEDGQLARPIALDRVALASARGDVNGIRYHQ